MLVIHIKSKQKIRKKDVVNEKLIINLLTVFSSYFDFHIDISHKFFIH